MNIGRETLYRIIIEEYLLEEGITESSAAEDLLKQIMGDKYRPPEERDPTRYANKDGNTAPMEKPHTAADETMPLPAEEEPSAIEEPSGSVESQISALIQGMEPETVAALFQSVFSQIPGVELGPSDEEPPPPTEYGGEEFDLRDKQGRLIGPRENFQFEDLEELIREVLKETEWYDLSAGDLPPPHSTATQEEPGKYKKLTTAYHALEDAVGQHPELQDALDIVAGLLDAMDTGDSMYRADENIDAEHAEDHRE